jgi:hypothetical protein
LTASFEQLLPLVLTQYHRNFNCESEGVEVLMNAVGVKFLGSVTDLSRSGIYEDEVERVTVSVVGAEPLYAELRVPNKEGWQVGQRVTVTIAPTDAGER